MPIDSLLETARRAAAKHIRNIVDIGDCPYELLRTVLLKIENPEQLHQLEINSPQVIGKTKEIWVALIKRDIPDWEAKIIYPNNPQNWWKVYRKLKKDVQRDNEASEALLKARLSGIKNEREENHAQLTTKKAMQAPPRRAKIKYNYASGRTGSGRGATPTNFFDKMKRDVGTRISPRMATPTHKLTQHSTRVTKAPLAMVEEIRARKHNPPLKSQSVTSQMTSTRSRSSLVHGMQSSKPRAEAYDMTQDREDRLRRLKAGQQFVGKSESSTNGNSLNGLSEDFLEDEDEDDSFEEEHPRKQLREVNITQTRRHAADVAGLHSRPGKRKDPPSLFHSPAKRKIG